MQYLRQILGACVCDHQHNGAIWAIVWPLLQNVTQAPLETAASLLEGSISSTKERWLKHIEEDLRKQQLIIDKARNIANTC